MQGQKIRGYREETSQLTKEGEKMGFVDAFVYRLEDSHLTVFLFRQFTVLFACLMLNHLRDNNEC